eukprot:6757517-Prymnesium_polylepis.1
MYRHATPGSPLVCLRKGGACLVTMTPMASHSGPSPSCGLPTFNTSFTRRCPRGRASEVLKSFGGGVQTCLKSLGESLLAPFPFPFLLAA